MIEAQVKESLHDISTYTRVMSLSLYLASFLCAEYWTIECVEGFQEKQKSKGGWCCVAIGIHIKGLVRILVLGHIIFPSLCA